MKSLLFILSLAAALPVFGESFSRSSRLEIGPDGVKVSAGGEALGVNVENGVATFNFSVSNTLNPRQAPPLPVVPAAPVRTAPSSFTNSDSFFGGIGKSNP